MKHASQVSEACKPGGQQIETERMTGLKVEQVHRSHTCHARPTRAPTRAFTRAPTRAFTRAPTRAPTPTPILAQRVQMHTHTSTDSKRQKVGVAKKAKVKAAGRGARGGHGRGYGQQAEEQLLVMDNERIAIPGMGYGVGECVGGQM